LIVLDAGGEFLGAPLPKMEAEYRDYVPLMLPLAESGKRLSVRSKFSSKCRATQISGDTIKRKS
jgi:hypothetical protein